MEWCLGVGHEIIAAPNQPDEITLTIDGTTDDGTPIHNDFIVRLRDFTLTSASPGGMESFVQEFKHFRNESRTARSAIVNALRRGSDRDDQP